jgi:hypothetical protein
VNDIRLGQGCGQNKIEDLIALAKERVTRSLTDEECRRYLHVDKCE